MRRFLLLALPLVLAAGCGGGRALAIGAAAAGSTAPVNPGADDKARAAAPRIRVDIPPAIGPFKFVRRQDYDDAALGTMVRYRHESDSLEADVFVYPGPDLAVRCDTPCAREELKSEYQGFIEQFEELRARGYFESIRVVAEQPLVPPAGAPWAMGQRIHLSVRREGREQRSEFWLAYLPGIRFKVRSTFVETPARVAAVQDFVDSAVVSFARTRGGDSSAASASEASASEASAAPPERPLPDRASADAIFGLLDGTWAWESAKEGCRSGTHRFAVAADRSEVLLIIAPATPAEPPDTTTYQVIEAGPQILPWAPFAIRLDMRGETRRTDDGALVKWDLVFATRDRYHWHRTDWPPQGITGAITRCPTPGSGP